MKVKKGRWMLAVACSVVVMLFVLGMIHMFRARFKMGDVYPVYSTLRADPLGTKVFYESLKECEGLTVSRSYEEFSEEEFLPGATVMFLGDKISAHESLPVETAMGLDRYARQGGRLVFVFSPRNWNPRKNKYDKKNKKKKSLEEIKEEFKDLDEEIEESESEDIDENDVKELDVDSKPKKRNHKKARKYICIHRWLGLDIRDESMPAADVAELKDDALTETLPRTISLHSSLVFSNAAETGFCIRGGMTNTVPVSEKKWTTIYSRRGNPVVLETKMGKGSIVLSAASYFTSNEAMKKERYPGLLSWLVGNNTRIVFDEAHHGIVSKKGVVVLAREYGLEWLGLGLVILALLYVWQHSVPLIPPQEAVTGDNVQYAEGRDSSAALRNLLRQNISGKKLLRACFEEWKKTVIHVDGDMEQKQQDIDEMISYNERQPRKLRDAKRVYNEICKILKKT